jgi:ABC-type lipoprotein export system ATPase subunit
MFREPIQVPTNQTDGAVHATDVVKSYGSVSAPVMALRGINLKIERGERVALLGKSGSGKSTLLNLIGGLDRPTSGNLSVAGKDLGNMSATELAQHRLATVGMIFQSFNLIATRTALQNVELPMIFAGLPPGDRRQAARQALEAVGLAHRLTHRPSELSGGEHQRVAIARALVNRPTLLLADEPTGNLDTATADQVLTLLSDHVRKHACSLILVTHDEELARRLTDRVLRMKDGLLVP